MEIRKKEDKHLIDCNKEDSDDDNPVTERDLYELKEHINMLLTPLRDKTEDGTTPTFYACEYIEVHRK